MRKLLAIAALCCCGAGLSAGAYAAEQKSVLIVVPQQNFQDREFQSCVQALDEQGVRVTIASVTTQAATGMYGFSVTPGLTLRDADALSCDAVVLIGGLGAGQLASDNYMLKLVQDAAHMNRVVAATSNAVLTLARAGILKNKRATTSAADAAALAATGAQYTGKPVEEDGKFITSSGPAAGMEFAQALLRNLQR